MKKGIFLFLGAALTIGLVLTAGGNQVATAEDKAVTIGFMQAWTGPLGPMGVVGRKGGLLAKQHINDDGGFLVGGDRYTLEFFEWDNRTDPKVAVAGAQKMMDEKNVKIMVGPMYSAATLACQPITQPRGVIQINRSSATQILRPGVTHTFRGTIDARMRATALSAYYKAMGIKTMGFIVENMATALSMHDNQAPAFEAAGGTIVGKEVFETGTTDFFTALARLKSKNPDALFICSNPEPAALVIRQTREIGWPVQTLAEGNPPTGPAFWEVSGSALEGHIDLTAVRGLDAGPKVNELYGFNMEIRKRFFKDIKEKYDLDPNLTVAQIDYDLVHIAVEAMKGAGSVDDTDKIRQALINLDWQGVSQRWKFFPSGQCVSLAMISRIHAGEGWTPIAIMEPADPELKNWTIIELEPVPQIKNIRAARGY